MIEAVRSTLPFTLCMCVCVLAACGSDAPTEPDVQVPARLEVTPTSITFDGAGQTLTIMAKVIDTNQMEIIGAVVEWSTSDPTVATVNKGIVVAVRYGTAQITARHGNLSRTVDVTVELR